MVFPHLIKHYKASLFSCEKKKGFTLIELLIAISILGVLSALLLANLQQARGRARDSRRKEDLYQVKQALRMYYNDSQVYPDDDSGEIDGYGWGSEFTVSSIRYMKELPEDPLSSQSYYYNQINTDQYEIYACLENTSDPNGSSDCGGLSCTSNHCYKVTED